MDFCGTRVSKSTLPAFARGPTRKRSSALGDRAPQALRSALLYTYDERAYATEGEFDPYRVFGRVLGKIGDEWGPSEKQYEVQTWMNALTLDQAQLLLNEAPLDETEENEINARLAQAGEDLRVRDSVLVNNDEVGEALDLMGLAHEPVALLTGQFKPVLQQYQRALDSLHAHPMQQEKAISEAMGALEAVVRLVSGNARDFGPNIKALFSNEEPWTRLLGVTISQFQGYRSQVPGAGHGRYKESDVTDAEAEFFVRSAGAAIAWIVRDHEAGRW